MTDDRYQLTARIAQIERLHPGIFLDLRTMARAEIAADYAATAAEHDHRLIAIREDDDGAAHRFTYADEVAASIFRIHTAAHGIELPDADIRRLWGRVAADLAAVSQQLDPAWVAARVQVWIDEREARINETVAAVQEDRGIPIPGDVVEDARCQIRGVEH
ncbi:hypothetical protein GCM10022286_00280 [Gryllotalpicola daejeonensis]|uniref:Uncharacterized protein n=1 Tax=Gryllotalpicola daejeonensis TaxID=993087 RepID=A0ABP7ZCN8_9MICO